MAAVDKCNAVAETADVPSCHPGLPSFYEEVKGVLTTLKWVQCHQACCRTRVTTWQLTPDVQVSAFAKLPAFRLLCGVCGGTVLAASGQQSS